jgi:hypothetical protein
MNSIRKKSGKAIRMKKPCEPRSLTLVGITIDFNEEQENTEDLICFNYELDSNEIDESDVQKQEYCEPNFSTLAGMKISLNQKLKNALPTIDLTASARPCETSTEEGKATKGQNSNPTTAAISRHIEIGDRQP